MEITFCDLRTKEVINVCDGKRLGCIVDMVFDSRTLKITGIVVPCEKSFFSFFKNNNDIFIPFSKICKIGKDVILVELTQISSQSVTTLNNETNLTPEQNNENEE